MEMVGRTAFGSDWQRPMARALGPYHPNGPRESIDDRLVRRWASAEREIPEWAIQSLQSILVEQAKDCIAHAEHMKYVAQQIPVVAPLIR